MREEQIWEEYMARVQRGSAINYFRELSEVLDSVFDADLRTISNALISSAESIQPHELTLLMPGVSAPVVTVDSLTGRGNIPTLSQKRLDLRGMKNSGLKQSQSQRLTGIPNTNDLNN